MAQQHSGNTGTRPGGRAQAAVRGSGACRPPVPRPRRSPSPRQFRRAVRFPAAAIPPVLWSRRLCRTEEIMTAHEAGALHAPGYGSVATVPAWLRPPQKRSDIDRAPPLRHLASEEELLPPAWRD